ncbi:acyltransferase family protein [Xanthobacter sp. KR7-225]|uniref:acyltransferase family protein n=1 Tax=Xanthobacter sp. KR7-225 TaxID=3156613 RepID=UPI0032B57F73
MKYRADIDGLRALAILPVVLFHGGIVTGGFVGVDVFFVISGFLITNIIYSEIVDNNFSIIKFYDRRIRRIIPALFFMIFCVTGLAFALFPAADLIDYGRSVIATTLFASNIYFWGSVDYFSDGERPLPLLHTWSLAVEEQFYIFFPIFLIVAMRFLKARAVFVALAAVAAVSLAASWWGAQEVPRLTFYMLPTRAWELLAGSLLALPVLRPLPSRHAPWVAWLGLVLLVVPMGLYTSQTTFPGITALPPVLGSALIIYAGMSGAGGTVKTLLSNPALVYVGRISYSLYLWHWPLLVFGYLYFGSDMGWVPTLVLIALSVALAAFSLHFVEAPFRRGALFPSLRMRYLGTACVMLLAIGVGYAIVGNNGFAGRMSPASRELMAQEKGNPLTRYCLNNQGFSLKETVRLPPADRCILESGPSSAPYHALIWGDSHADALTPGLRAYLGQDVPLRQVSKAGCPPLIGATGYSPRQRSRGSRCEAFNIRVMAELAAVKDVSTVYIAGRWSDWLGQSNFGADINYLIDARSDELSAENSRRVLKAALNETVRKLRAMGRQVVLFGEVPEFKHQVTGCLVRKDFLGVSAQECSVISREEFAATVGPARAILAEVARENPDVTVVFPDTLLCDEKRCSAFNGSELLYRDSHHLSATGARWLFARIPRDALPTPTRAAGLESPLGAPRPNAN